MLRLELEAEVEGHNARASIARRLPKFLIVLSEAEDLERIRIAGTARLTLIVTEHGAERCRRVPRVELRVVENVVSLDLYLKRAPLVLADRNALFEGPVKVV